MKLKNRFPDNVKSFWAFWNSCLVCGKQATEIHHIVSGSSMRWHKGKHNESVLNSCPICNHCHATKPLHNQKTEDMLLKKVLDIVAKKTFDMEYKKTKVDEEFYEVYLKVIV